MSAVGRKQGLTTMVSRRDFLRVGGLSVVSLSVSEQAALARRTGADRRRVIFLLMSGGASQLETFDPKPDAPAEIRGPLRAISTAVPGLCLSEGLPRLAELQTVLHWFVHLITRLLQFMRPGCNCCRRVAWLESDRTGNFPRSAR